MILMKKNIYKIIYNVINNIMIYSKILQMKYFITQQIINFKKLKFYFIKKKMKINNKMNNNKLNMKLILIKYKIKSQFLLIKVNKLIMNLV